MRIMKESSDQRVGNTTSRPTFVFPLGTGLILLIVFGVSALFSCCYHWEKIRTMHNRHHYRSAAAAAAAPGGANSSLWPTSRANFTPPVTAPPSWRSLCKNIPLHQSRKSLAVMMPGDDVPKFLAMPSPHGFAPQDIRGSAVGSSHMNQSKRLLIRP